jgi:hypothetical protein
MTQAFNLSQLANKVNTSGQLNTSNGLNGTIPDANLANSGVSAGTYQNANVTVDAKGRVTSASNGAGGGFANMQVFTSSGAFTTPSTTTKLKLTVVGGGGNGANGWQSPTPISQQNAFGAGGGGGGFASGVVSVSASTPYPVTVGGATQTSSFGGLMSATGGTTGSTASAGSGGTGTAPTGFAMTGAAGNYINISSVGRGGAAGNGFGQPTSASTRQPGGLYGGGGNGGGPGASPSVAPAGAGRAGIVIVEW